MSALTIGSLSACGEMKPGTVTPGESPAGDSGHPDQPNMVTATRRSEEHKSFLYSSFLIYLLEIQGNAVLSQR